MVTITDLLGRSNTPHTPWNFNLLTSLSFTNFIFTIVLAHMLWRVIVRHYYCKLSYPFVTLNFLTYPFIFIFFGSLSSEIYTPHNTKNYTYYQNIDFHIYKDSNQFTLIVPYGFQKIRQLKSPKLDSQALSKSGISNPSKLKISNTVKKST